MNNDKMTDDYLKVLTEKVEKARNDFKQGRTYSHDEVYESAVRRALK